MRASSKQVEKEISSLKHCGFYNNTVQLMPKYASWVMQCTTRTMKKLVIVSLALSVFVEASAFAAPKLPSFNVDLSQSSVSGLSAGAFMAVQFHVAFSSTVVGAGIIAGGPYYCTEGSQLALWFYLNRCTIASFWAPSPSAAKLLRFARRFSANKEIDSLSNLTDDRVYIFSGTNDRAVKRSIVNQTNAFYSLAGVSAENLQYVDDSNAGHAIITKHYGNRCKNTASPFINDCDYDQAGAILIHIYRGLSPPTRSEDAGRILAFSQSEFVDHPRSHSMAEVGYAYVPRSCAEGVRCRVHIAFHGCGQTTQEIGDQFYRQAGYNEWAATNNIIVLYPQLVELAWKNPQGCWDWWGYSGGNYYNKKAPQMAAVMGMLERLAGQD